MRHSPPSTRYTVAATPDASSVAVNCTVAVSLRQRDPMPFAVVTGGVTSPGEGEAVGVMVGTASGAASGSDSGGVAGTVGDGGGDADDARQSEADGGDEDEQMAVHVCLPAAPALRRGGPRAAV